MSILLIAEHDNLGLKNATLHALTAATQIGGEITLLVAGYQVNPVVEQARQVAGINQVLVADDLAYEHQLAENMGQLVAKCAPSYTHVVMAATSIGKNLLPRVAALLDVQQISDITGVVSCDTFRRPIYAGNAIATLRSNDAIKVITVRASAFDAASSVGGDAKVESVDLVFDLAVSRFVSEELTQSDRPDLTAARVVVSGGRGMGCHESFALIDRLADKLGAAVGASRAAVDAGFAASDMQVGQTGKIVAPELYIAVAISGAIQHLAGMKESKCIVAINKDVDAPIFQVADYGLVADLFDVIPELTDKL